MKMFGKDDQVSICVGSSLEWDTVSNGQEICDNFIAQTNARRNLLLLICLANDEPLMPQIAKPASWQLTSKTCKATWRKRWKRIFLKSEGHAFSAWIDLVRGPWAWCRLFIPFVLFLDQTDFYCSHPFFHFIKVKRQKAFPLCATQCESYCPPQHKWQYQNRFFFYFTL